LEDILTDHKENVRAQAGFIWLRLFPQTQHWPFHFKEFVLIGWLAIIVSRKCLNH